MLQKKFLLWQQKKPWQKLQHVRGRRAGSTYELDAARSMQSKFFPNILDLPKHKSLPNSILCYFVMKKTHTMTFLQGDCSKQINS